MPTKSSPSSGRVTVEFQPIGRRVPVEGGSTLLRAAQQAGLGIVALCGGDGWCESCRVRIEHGNVTPPTDSERAVFSPQLLDDGWRLACQAAPLTDARVSIPPESLDALQRLQVEGRLASVAVEPLVQAYDLHLSPPTLQDQRADDERVKEALEEAGRPGVVIDELVVLEHLSRHLRQNHWDVRAVLRDSRLVATLPTACPLLGLAVDIGTTKVAAYLVDLEAGDTLAKSGAMNPQIAFGEDLISRIGYTERVPAGRAQLQRMLIDTLNEMIAALCSEASVEPWQIVQAVVVGNTAMHHLFAGLPVEQLARAPYVPALSHALLMRASELGLQIAPGACVDLLPNIAGYVGADHVAVILAAELWNSARTLLAIDIGTNTEITLAAGGTLSSCSCASGPAFEGAHIRDGMRAAPGAIEHVQIKDGELFLSTIDSRPPIGICGSGILDAVAALRGAGILNEKGAIRRGEARTRETVDGLEYVLVPSGQSGHGRPITISRNDVNEVQLAKAAIRTGIDILLDHASLSAGDLDEILIAGAFGTYIDLTSAVAIGMLPGLPREHFKQIGNAAGMGAKLALLSRTALVEATRIAGRVQYVELTTYPGFQSKFLKNMYL